MANSKVYFLIGHLWQGGGERVCVNLANRLAKRGYDVEVIVGNLNQQVYLEDLSVPYKSLNVNSQLAFFMKLFVFMLKNRPKNFLVFNYNLSFFLAILKPIFKIKYIARSLNTLSSEFDSVKGWKKLKLKVIIFSLNQANGVVSQSKGMERDLISLGVKGDNIVVINNPVDKVNLLPDMSSDEDYILFVGRLEEQKGLEYLINALLFVNKNIALKIVGEGSEKEKIQALVLNLGLESRVSFLGYLKDMTNHYLSAKCTVLSSIYEGFPNVLLESLAHGTPVVSFDCPNGPSEIIFDGVNGYLAEYLNINDLADKINLAADKSFSRNDVCKTVERFSIDKITANYESIFDRTFSIKAKGNL